MDTKKAIDIMKLTIKNICEGDEEPITICECHEVIDCLQQGEKYKQMWKELYQDCTFLESVEKMHDLKEEYFPKDEVIK